MRSSPLSTRLGLFAALSLVPLAGCTSQWNLDAERAEIILDRVAESSPLCSTPAAGAGGGVTARATGSCGGTLTATSEHENGDTTYSVNIDQYCLEGPEEEITTSGAATIVKDGSPSDLGPVIDGVEASSDGTIAVVHGGKTQDVVLGRLRTDFGYPDVDPGTPDEESPNVITLDRIDVIYRDAEDRNDFLRNVRIERTGGRDAATIHILDGQGGTEGEGFVEVRTPEDDPFVIDFVNGALLGGSIELQGTGDSVITITPDPSRSGVYVLTLNGEDYTREVDCSGASAPLIQGMLALMVEVPIF